MSVHKRIWDLARSELNALFDRAGHGLRSDSAPGTSGSEPGGPPRATASSSDRIRGYYAQLELTPEASWQEVRSAYRRLMRRYHPDRHTGDPEKTRIANELAQRLRVAYEGLRDELTGGQIPRSRRSRTS